MATWHGTVTRTPNLTCCVTTSGLQFATRSTKANIICLPTALPSFLYLKPPLTPICSYKLTFNKFDPSDHHTRKEKNK